MQIRRHESRRFLSGTANVTVESTRLDCCFVRKVKVMSVCTTVALEAEDKCHGFTLAGRLGLARQTGAIPGAILRDRFSAESPPPHDQPRRHCVGPPTGRQRYDGMLCSVR
jgi:hypothetical protein